MALPSTLPPPPHPPEPDVLQAHTILQNGYLAARDVVNLGQPDLHQVHYHQERVLLELVPLLDAISASTSDTVMLPWCSTTTIFFVNLYKGLAQCEMLAKHSEGLHASVYPVTAERHSQRGRPRKAINEEYLQEALHPSRNISRTKLANVLKVHRNTLKRRIDDLGIYCGYSAINDTELDLLVRGYKLKKPDAGFRYVRGHLRSLGIRIQKQRVLNALRRVDRIGRLIRRRTVIRRRRYFSSRPNALWHCDGHHKLIKYGFVIHGFIDGNCRTVTALRASPDNLASTVLELFLSATAIYGTPYRVRGDRGGENVLVSAYMITKRGPNRGSFLWGSSTHNTRIERLWVEVGRNFCRTWRAFFNRLEDQFELDCSNPSHIWLLQMLFLDDLNADCGSFVREWNSHPISGNDTGDMSPQDLRFLRQTQLGVYDEDDCQGIHPDVIQQYYGTTETRVHRHMDQTGAGHPPEEYEDDLVGEVVEDQDPNVRHDAIPTAYHEAPLTAPELLAVFSDAIDTLRSNDNEGVLRSIVGPAVVWDPVEVVKVGHRRRKELVISLDDATWERRALLWTVALRLLDNLDMRSCTIPIGRMLCPCKGYQAGPKRDICDLCEHLSSHHDSSPTAVPLSMVAATGSSSGRARSVTSLFQQLLKSTPSGAAALRETSNGLRKQQVGYSQTKQPGTRAASQSIRERDIFRFRSVVFITCGLEAVQESKMLELAVPTQALGGHDVQVAVRNGLGISSPSERELFELNRNSTLPDINIFLRDRMPQLFNHFARDEPWISTINSSAWNDGDRVWPYVLLARRTNRTLVPALLNGHVDPTISDLRENCGRKGASPSERVIFLATVQEITSKTVGKWVLVQSPNLENDALNSSDNEPSEVEISSPPRKRPVTRSVSAKRAADEMEGQNLLSSPILLPPAKRTRRETAAAVEPPLFIADVSDPEILEVPTIPKTATHPCPDENYFLLENPWSEKISYF